VNIHRITAMVPITDLERAITFYTQGLGLQVIKRNDEWGHALLEGEHGCQVMIDRSIRTESNAATVVYYYTSDLEAVRSRLIAAGFKPEPIDVTFYGMTEFRVHDPDGNEVWVGAREAPAT
jgi:catechol 2,3-dioxygenase-like lactoylglutathione lyase family enzyme